MDSIPSDETLFIELQPPEEAGVEAFKVQLVTSTVSAVLHSTHGITIDLYDSVSSDFICKISGALAYAE